jgi:hypothetical protein
VVGREKNDSVGRVKKWRVISWSRVLNGAENSEEAYDGLIVDAVRCVCELVGRKGEKRVVKPRTTPDPS